MNSKNLGGDFNFAWPTAEIAVMGPEGAVAILYRNELAESDDPVMLKKELAQKYRDEIANPYIADEKGFIDEVKQRPKQEPDGLSRILLWGNEIDDIAFVELVEA